MNIKILNYIKKVNNEIIIVYKNGYPDDKFIPLIQYL